METIFICFGLLAIGYSLTGFYGLWRAPRLFATWAYSPRMLVGRLPDDRATRILKLGWFGLFGAYLALSNAGALLWSLIPFAGFMVATFALVRRHRISTGGRPN